MAFRVSQPIPWSERTGSKASDSDLFCEVTLEDLLKHYSFGNHGIRQSLTIVHCPTRFLISMFAGDAIFAGTMSC